MTTPAVHTLTVSVDRDAATVEAFVRDSATLPVWAPGFARAARRDGEGWAVTTATGEVQVRFVADNPYGVVDHRVTGPVVDVVVPMRVVPAGPGCAVLFTLVAAPDADPAEVARDLALVRSDLERLKSVMEDSPAPHAAG